MSTRGFAGIAVASFLSLFPSCGASAAFPSCASQAFEIVTGPCSGGGCGNAAVLRIDDSVAPPVARMTVGQRAYVRIVAYGEEEYCLTGPYPAGTDIRWTSTNPAVLEVTPREPRALAGDQAFLRALAPGQALVQAQVPGQGRVELARCSESLDSCVPVAAVVVIAGP
jgi:hypothetical protein